VPVNFDRSKEVTIFGVLTEIKWVNPHSRFRVNVTGDDGKTVEWLVDMGAINTMRRAGFDIDRFAAIGRRGKTLASACRSTAENSFFRVVELEAGSEYAAERIRERRKASPRLIGSAGRRIPA
jgi:hypothetical protein